MLLFNVIHILSFSKTFLTSFPFLYTCMHYAGQKVVAKINFKDTSEQYTKMDFKCTRTSNSNMHSYCRINENSDKVVYVRCYVQIVYNPGAV